MNNQERTKAQQEIEAAKQRLKGFMRKGEHTDYHDPVRWANLLAGKKDAPRYVTWWEVERDVL